MLFVLFLKYTEMSHDLVFILFFFTIQYLFHNFFINI